MIKKQYIIPEIKSEMCITNELIAASTTETLGGAGEYDSGGELSGSRRKTSAWDDNSVDDNTTEW